MGNKEGENMRKKLLAIVVGLIFMMTAIGFSACGTVSEEAGGGMHTVTVYGAPETVFLSVKHGEPVTKNMFLDQVYGDTGILLGEGYDCFYTDKECVTRYVDESVTEDITIYARGYFVGFANTTVNFIYNNSQYSIHRGKGTKLTAEDFSRSAYGHGAPEDYLFYSDEEMTVPFPIEGYELSDQDLLSLTIYVSDKS